MLSAITAGIFGIMTAERDKMAMMEICFNFTSFSNFKGFKKFITKFFLVLGINEILLFQLITKIQL